MAKITFRLIGKSDNEPIYLRIYEGKKLDVQKKTGFFINYKDWKVNKKHGNYPDENNEENIKLKEDLKKLDSFIFNKKNESIRNNIEITSNWLTQQIDLHFGRIKNTTKSELVIDNIQHVIDTADTRENGKKGIGLSQCRVNGYKRLKELFIEFQGKEKYQAKDLDQNMFDSFRKWLLTKKKYAPTYSYKKCVDLKSVCKDARKNGVEVSHDLTDIKTKQVSAYDDDMDVIILTPDELEKIEKVELPTNALENARKWLLLGCYTGQRGNDLTTRINAKNFEHYGNDLIIKIKQQKGNKSVIIPVLPKVREIYENSLPYVVSLVKLNQHFKEIGRLAGLDEMVMGRKQEKGKRGIKKLRPKYEYLSTHIGRRSFASNHYGEIPTPIIMRVTGHSKESTFLTYINQTDNSHVDTFLDFYKSKEKTEKKGKLKMLKTSNKK